jgi:hypothetical protein
MLQLLPSHRSATVNGAGVKISPTAVHAEGDEHETPLKKSPCPSVPGGVGVDWTVHVVPSHRSASSAEAVLPTAVHALGEVHETAFRKAPGLPEVGVGWMLQVVPSHRSVIVPTGLPEPSKATPTAVHITGDVHATPFRPLPAAPAGLGVGVMRHAVPSQRSARVPPVDCPTDMQDEGELQATPLRWAPRTPSGLAVGWTLH